MTINKFQGRTKEEAIEKAKAEMGPKVVIMNAKEIKAKGFLGAMGLKSGGFEVTAAIEESEQIPVRSKTEPVTRGGFSAVADEKIKVEPVREGDDDWQGALAELSKILGRTSEPVSRPIEPKPAPVKEAVPVKPVIEVNNEEKINKMQATEQSEIAVGQTRQQQRKNSAFIKVLYNHLLDHEVDEHYINQLMDDVDNILRDGASVDYMLSNIYQKMVLKLGKPEVITLGEKQPKLVFFVGPTGVGKTTTIAKLASKFKLEMDKKVALLTADTYRIAAVEQLRTYANIMGVPLAVVYSADELMTSIEQFGDYDLILVDTAGFSHRNEAQREEMRKLLATPGDSFDKQFYLVMSSTTKYKDLLDIADSYRDLCDYNLIFTKLDETDCYGNIYNLKQYTGADISYVTTGQNVPDDIEVMDTQAVVKQLLGGM